MSIQADSNSQQHNSYPPSFPSPSMAGAQGNSMHYSSYPEGQASPPAPGASSLSLNLPALHSGNGRSAPQQHQPPGQGPPPPQHMQFYTPYPHMPPPTDPNVPIRYPLPPHPEGRVMSGGRHKKEIKRRTKTGCLTCRKRRIKCDEGHPACRNCQKSKRECLGYDPIFKPQQTGPTAIQPAAQQYPTMSGTPPASYPPPPAHNFSLASYGAPIPNADRFASESKDSLDPALEAEKQGSESNGSMADGTSDQNPGKVRRRTIEELLCINGVSPPPPAPPSTLSETNASEIKQIYSTAYAPGMDKFLDTRWFSERGLDHLMANSILCDQFSLLISRYAMNPQDPVYPVQLAITMSLEAVVVWSMLCMCQKVASTKDENGEVNENEVKEGVIDAAKRLEIFEAMVTGEYSSGDVSPKEPDSSRPNGSVLQAQLKSKEYEFWRSVHQFLTIQKEGEESRKTVNDTLATTRSLLENRENRDVIYSIMIVRHYGPQVPGFPDTMKAPETNDEKDAHAKLSVAKRLLEEEANGKGTNQVVQRLCGVAVRSWAMNR